MIEGIHSGISVTAEEPSKVGAKKKPIHLCTFYGLCIIMVFSLRLHTAKWTMDIPDPTSHGTRTDSLSSNQMVVRTIK